MKLNILITLMLFHPILGYWMIFQKPEFLLINFYLLFSSFVILLLKLIHSFDPIIFSFQSKINNIIIFN